jgi:nucleoside-diphosphate-sugar epimerase
VRVLITGATGFIGSYLSSLLYEDGHEVYGTNYGVDNSKGYGVIPAVKMFECDSPCPPFLGRIQLRLL